MAAEVTAARRVRAVGVPVAGSLYQYVTNAIRDWLVQSLALHFA
jgi:hypothetical protein